MTGLGPDSNFHTQRLWSTPLYRAPPQGVPVRTFTYLTAALLVVALIVTAIGVSTYRDDRDVEFSVSWSMDSEEFADTATRAGAGEAELSFTLASANLTHVYLNISITAGGNRVNAVTATAELVDPDGVRYPTGTATFAASPATPTQTIPLEARLASVPTRDTVIANSPANAFEAVAADNATMLGQGEWTVTVTFSSSGALDGQSVGATYNLSLSGTAHRYSANVTRDLPDINR